MKVPSDDLFIKATFSPLHGDHNCVAVARTDEGVFVRDTKDSGKSTLSFTNDEWSAFVKGVKADEFNV